MYATLPSLERDEDKKKAEPGISVLRFSVPSDVRRTNFFLGGDTTETGFDTDGGDSAESGIRHVDVSFSCSCTSEGRTRRPRSLRGNGCMLVLFICTDTLTFTGWELFSDQFTFTAVSTDIPGRGTHDPVSLGSEIRTGTRWATFTNDVGAVSVGRVESAP